MSPYHLDHAASAVLIECVPGLAQVGHFGDTQPKFRATYEYIRNVWNFWEKHQGRDHLQVQQIDFTICKPPVYIAIGHLGRCSAGRGLHVRVSVSAVAGVCLDRTSKRYHKRSRVVVIRHEPVHDSHVLSNMNSRVGAIGQMYV